VLTTPVRRAELLAGKALAIFLPALVISYCIGVSRLFDRERLITGTRS
jgi:ABC-type Na+ efflux pump permease subunit